MQRRLELDRPRAGGQGEVHVQLRAEAEDGLAAQRDRVLGGDEGDLDVVALATGGGELPADVPQPAVLDRAGEIAAGPEPGADQGHAAADGDAGPELGARAHPQQVLPAGGDPAGQLRAVEQEHAGRCGGVDQDGVDAVRDAEGDAVGERDGGVAGGGGRGAPDGGGLGIGAHGPIVPRPQEEMPGSSSSGPAVTA